ncbi:MAG: hypothetical protein ABI726_07185 [bacterium]
MDVSKLSTGEKIAGISGVALLLIMFIFNWFSYGEGPLAGGLNAWDSMDLIRFILFLAAISGIALAATAASQSNVDLPVALSAITAGLGILAVVLVIFRIISPPDFGLGDVAEAFGGANVDVGRSIGVFLGLIAAGGVAYGGWAAMQEEGSSMSGPADRVGGGDDAPSPPPPPPPPASPPPPSGGAPGGPAV